MDDGLPTGMEAPAGEPKCRVCGCWEYSACFDPFTLDGCYWIAEPEEHPDGPICSACAATTEVLE